VIELIELSRDERRFVRFLCIILLAAAAANFVKSYFPGFAAKIGLLRRRKVVFRNMSPADSAALASLIERAAGSVREDKVFPLDINECTTEELELLPGVGPVRAAAIVRLREELGGFDEIEDLLEVRGIGPATLEEMRPYVSLGDRGRQRRGNESPADPDADDAAGKGP